MNQISFWRSAFTTADNQTGDLARVMWFVSHSLGWVMAIWHNWPANDILMLHGGIAAAFSGSLKLKQSTEPVPPAGGA